MRVLERKEKFELQHVGMKLYGLLIAVSKCIQNIVSIMRTHAEMWEANVECLLIYRQNLHRRLNNCDNIYSWVIWLSFRKIIPSVVYVE